jgi:predicted ATPase
VRSLIDADLVYHDSVVWRARAEIAEVAVPESIQSVILSRVDRLEAETRHVLQSAAVIGRLFRRRLLEHVARQETELGRALAELEDRQLIYAERAIPEEEYSFHHVLAQETVYRNILRRRRVVFHQQVAEAMERLYGDNLEEYYEQLAHHYEQAGVQEKALEYLERAGDKAQAQYANATAEGYYRDLVERLDTLGRALDAARVREKLAAVLSTVGHFEAALVVLELAAQTYRTAQDQASLVRATARIGWLHSRLGRVETGISCLQPVVAALPTDESDDALRSALATAYAALANLYFVAGSYHEQLATARKAAALARGAGNLRALAEALETQGQALMLLVGHRREAVPVVLEACAVAEATGDLYHLAYALGDMAEICWAQGQSALSRDYCERALAAARRQGNAMQMAGGVYIQALQSFGSGEWVQARAEFQQAVALCRQVGTLWFMPIVLSALGRLHLAMGEREAAVQAWEEGLAAVEGGGNVNLFGRRRLHNALAELDLQEGRPAAARDRLLPLLDRPGLEETAANPLLVTLAWAQLEAGETAQAGAVIAQALERLRADDDQVDLVEALRVQAMVAIRQHQWDAAAQALAEGLELARAMPYSYAEGRLLRLYGEMHITRGESELAHERLEAALAIFERLGARADAGKAELTLSGLG